MGDQNQYFLSSLRNSPGKSPPRRSSLAVSNWYSPQTISTNQQLPASPKVMGISNEGDRRLSLSQTKNKKIPVTPISTDSKSVRTNAPQKTINTYRNSVWDPPVSCQRRLLPGSQYQSYFPIEITDRDYFNRLIALLVRAVHSLDYEFLRTNVGNNELSDLSNAVEELLNIIIANSPSDKAGNYTHNVVLLYHQSLAVRECLDEHAKPFLIARDRLSSHSSGWDCCLLDNIDNVFEAATSLIDITKDYTTMRTEPLNVKTSTDMIRHEVRDLLGQYKIHKQFQQQRMKELGWEKSFDDIKTYGRVPETTEDKDDFQATMKKFHLQRERAEQFLTFTAGARVQLITRLLVIVDDLMLVSRDVSEDSDYTEAHRLRVLMYSIDQSVSADNRRFVDEAILLAQQIYVTMLELLHLVARKKEEMEFKNSEIAEQASAIADQLHKRLAAITSKCSLLIAHDDIKEKILREGTSFICADYLFISEYREDNVNIASLLVMSGAQDILNCVEEWTGLSILNRQKQKLLLNDQSSKSLTVSNTPNHSSSMMLLKSSRLSNSDLLSHPTSSRIIHGEQIQSSTTPNHTTSIDGNFSQTMLQALQSFESLQYQLDDLLTPISVAHSELLCRLIGIRSNVLQLVEMNSHTGNHSEKIRLSEFSTILDATIDADEQDYLEEEDGLIGRGRKRIDGVWGLTKQVQSAIQELRKFKNRARAQSDYTAAQAFDDMERNLEERVQNVEHSIQQFSLLDSDNDTTMMEVVDLNERIARDGTEFLTSDFIFSYCSGPKGHSIGSLAIVAGAGALLRYIKSQWPNLTVLGNSNRTDVYAEDEYTTSGHSTLFPPSSSFEKTAMLVSSSLGNFESTVVNRRKSNRLSVAMFNNGSGSGGTTGILSNTVVDFRDPNVLRLIGFDPKTLRSAGFSDIDILTAGFTAEQLKLAGFGPDAIFAAAGLSSPALQAVGFGLDMLVQVLNDFFIKTNGSNWRKHDIWRDLPNFVHHLTCSKQEKGSNSQKHSIIMQFLGRMRGVSMNTQTDEIERLTVVQNHLSGDS